MSVRWVQRPCGQDGRLGARQIVVDHPAKREIAVEAEADDLGA